MTQLLNNTLHLLHPTSTGRYQSTLGLGPSKRSSRNAFKTGGLVVTATAKSRSPAARNAQKNGAAANSSVATNSTPTRNAFGKNSDTEADNSKSKVKRFMQHVKRKIKQKKAATSTKSMAMMVNKDRAAPPGGAHT